MRSGPQSTLVSVQVMQSRPPSLMDARAESRKGTTEPYGSRSMISIPPYFDDSLKSTFASLSVILNLSLSRELSSKLSFISLAAAGKISLA